MNKLLKKASKFALLNNNQENHFEFSFKEWNSFLKDIAQSYYSPEVDPSLFISFADSDLSKYLYSLAIQGKTKWSLSDFRLLLKMFSEKHPHTFSNLQVLNDCIDDFSDAVYQRADSEIYIHKFF